MFNLTILFVAFSLINSIQQLGSVWASNWLRPSKHVSESQVKFTMDSLWKRMEETVDSRRFFDLRFSDLHGKTMGKFSRSSESSKKSIKPTGAERPTKGINGASSKIFTEQFVSPFTMETAGSFHFRCFAWEMLMSVRCFDWCAAIV